MKLPKILKNLLPFRGGQGRGHEGLGEAVLLGQWEHDGHILVSNGEDGYGVVFDHELYEYFQLQYVARMAAAVRRFGTIDRYYRAIRDIPRARRKYAADRDLLALLDIIRIVHDIPADATLSLVFMNEDLTAPVMVGMASPQPSPKGKGVYSALQPSPKGKGVYSDLHLSLSPVPQTSPSPSGEGRGEASSPSPLGEGRVGA